LWYIEILSWHQNGRFREEASVRSLVYPPQVQYKSS
jgi:hypothetical protein